MRKQLLLLGVFGLFVVQAVQSQFEIPAKPKFQTSVYDYINLLTPNQKGDLERKLIRYSDTTSTQIVVAIIASTQGENIAYLAANWGEKWGIGQKGKDNGILVLLARNDRKITISTGKGAEARLTDLMSRRIIESRIIPQFKSGDYYAGLDAGVEGIFQVLQGEFKETKKQPKRKKKKGKKGWISAPIIIIMFIIIFANRGGRGGGRGRRRRSTAGTLMDIIILSSLGRSGGGGFGGGSSGGSFGGGGFGGGFGGGSFGGGGATGSW